MKPPRIIVTLSVAVGIGLILLWSGAFRQAADTSPAVYVDDPAEVSAHVELVGVNARMVENFLGHQVLEVEGRLWNVGDHALGSVEVKLDFYGFDGEVVLESRDEALRRPLPPGEEGVYVFRLEALPTGWNHRAPGVEIVRIGY